MGECLKTIIYADYPEQWSLLLDWVKHNLQDQQVYGALFVLRILSSKYELVCFMICCLYYESGCPKMTYAQGL